MGVSDQHRTSVITVKCSPDFKKKVKDLAKVRGNTTSTMALKLMARGMGYGDVEIEEITDED